ncbi:hypothetical protein FACS1894200_00840 [Spirochaetia bacterium]|nr:hypothetical protein FACS1894200_00840 [Spirochaetia bacterium]
MTFRAVLVQLVKDRGIGVLGYTARRKAFISDYAGNYNGSGVYGLLENSLYYNELK